MRRRSLALLVALVLVSGLSGCGRLLGKRYNNFTAYYNTYYNAREEFEREEEKLLNQERPVERDRFLPLFIEPSAQSGQNNAGFENAIKKGANLLREHPESKWVDDALLLIGKARFYQADWAGAEEKFREVIDLGERRLDAEAWFWLGRALTAAERYDDAAQALREGIDSDERRTRWDAPMRLVLAEVDVRRGELDDAVVSLESGLEELRDKELAARAAFLLGQVYEEQGQPAKAADAYARVLDYGPRYELAYAAQLSQALALGLEGESDRGLELLLRMSRDDKNFQNRAEVEMTRARVLAAAERPGEARDLLRRLLYDPDPSIRTGTIQGPIHYYLADVYRDGLRDYVRAAAHYDTASVSLRQSPDASIRYTSGAITDAPERAGAFGSYASATASIAEMDSLLYLGGLDDEAFAAAVEQIRVERRAAAEAEARDLARRRAEQGFGDGAAGPGGFDDSRRNPGEPVDDVGDPGGGDVTAAPQQEGTDLGFLAYRNPVRVQEQLIGFQARWGDRPLVPNWRRAAAIGGELAVGQELAEVVEGVPSIETGRVAGDALVDVDAVPRDPVAQQQMRVGRATTRYELGNVLFLSLGEPEAAASLYRQIIEEDGESALAQRAYFALAETQRTLGNEAEADDLYRQVLDRNPESTLADQVRERLGLAARKQAVVADSLVQAEAAYSLAYGHWQDGEYAVALDEMLTIGETYPTTPVAARARLAAGTLYTEWAAGDSTALLALTPAVRVAPDVAPAALPPPTEAGDPSAPPARPSLATYTWIVKSDLDSVAVMQEARRYRELGLDAEVLSAVVEGRRKFRLGLGRYATREAALAARPTLPDGVPPETWLLALPARLANEPVNTPAGVPADSAAAGATVTMADEGRPAVTDSLAVTDSSLAVPVAASHEEPWLYALYAGIEQDYPSTVYAERALANRTALAERYPLDIEDETPAAGDSLADARSSEEAAEGLPANGTPADGTPADTSSALVTMGSTKGFGVGNLFGGDLSNSEGGFSWVVYTSQVRQEAVEVVLALSRLGYKAALVAEADPDIPAFRALVGQFASEEEATAARDLLPGVRAAGTPYVMAVDAAADDLQPPRLLEQNNEQRQQRSDDQ